MDPTKNPTRNIHCEGEAGLSLTDGGVSVPHDAGGDENDGARWKVDDQTELQKHKMPALGGIELPKGTDHTPAEGNVGGVAVASTDAPRSKVEGRRGPNAVLERGVTVRMVLVEGLALLRVVSIDFRCILLKGGWAYGMD